MSNIMCQAICAFVFIVSLFSSQKVASEESSFAVPRRFFHRSALDAIERLTSSELVHLYKIKIISSPQDVGEEQELNVFVVDKFNAKNSLKGQQIVKIPKWSSGNINVKITSEWYCALIPYNKNLYVSEPHVSDFKRGRF